MSSPGVWEVALIVLILTALVMLARALLRRR